MRRFGETGELGFPPGSVLGAVVSGWPDMELYQPRHTPKRIYFPGPGSGVLVGSSRMKIRFGVRETHWLDRPVSVGSVGDGVEIPRVNFVQIYAAQISGRVVGADEPVLYARMNLGCQVPGNSEIRGYPLQPGTLQRLCRETPTESKAMVLCRPEQEELFKGRVSAGLGPSANRVTFDVLSPLGR